MKTLSLLLISSLGFTESLEESIFVGGWDNWKYFYEPALLPLPPSASIEHEHGIFIDESSNIIITYKDQHDYSKCLFKWNEYDKQPQFLGPGKSLCQGVPHGLSNDRDDQTGEIVLYHANNEQVIHKTTIDGDILWSTVGPPASNNVNETYSPTWMAAEPNSPFVYLADGYGSNHIYVYYKANGTFTGFTFGGVGTMHGKFQTCHSIYWDDRDQKLAVCDRENHRLEYITVNAKDPSVFEYSHTMSFLPYLQRLCNLRVTAHGIGILASLEGMVGIVNEQNQLLSVLNITRYLGDRGFLHPHDAHFLPNGDFVLVTWNPGRIGYFRRAGTNEHEQQRQEVDR